MINWYTPFEESMFDKRVVVLCMTEELASTFLSMSRDRGMRWRGGSAIDPQETYADPTTGEVCYHLTPEGLRRGPRYVAEERPEWRDYIKCTFYGSVLQDFELPNTTSLLLD